MSNIKQELSVFTRVGFIILLVLRVPGPCLVAVAVFVFFSSCTEGVATRRAGSAWFSKSGCSLQSGRSRGAGDTWPSGQSGDLFVYDTLFLRCKFGTANSVRGESRVSVEIVETAALDFARLRLPPFLDPACIRSRRGEGMGAPRCHPAVLYPLLSTALWPCARAAAGGSSGCNSEAPPPPTRSSMVVGGKVAGPEGGLASTCRLKCLFLRFVELESSVVGWLSCAGLDVARRISGPASLWWRIRGGAEWTRTKGEREYASRL
ncbi:unnamed protein product [Scytosiphon promiscuus]